MSPLMLPIVLAVLTGSAVFVVGLLTRKRKTMLIGAPAALLLVIWFFLASWPPNPQKEFDRLFGAGNRGVVSTIQTLKPTLMDGHFISFHMGAADFDVRIRPQFSESGFMSSHNLLSGQPLPDGWPSAIETASSALHREVEQNDVYLLYFPQEETAYASILYPSW